MAPGPVSADPDGIYLADSFVLGIETGPASVCFELEAVLERDHPAFYWPPKQGERHAYARICWCLRGAVTWQTGPVLDTPVQDPSGVPDYGNIDSALIDGDVVSLEGEWGAVTIRGAAQSVELLDP